MMNDLVSIIIPYYQCEKYIEETLECIVKQTHQNIETIIVNDGSPKEFLEKIEKKYTNINLKILHQENQRQAATRNNGSAISKGEFLLFLDCDDLIAENYIEKTLAVLKSDKTIRIAYSKSKYFEGKKGEWFLPDYEKKAFLIENCIPVTALIYKSDFEKVGGFDKEITFFEDWDLWISIIKEGGSVHRINEFLFFYRIQNSQQSWSDNFQKNYEMLGDNYFKIYKKHYKYYKENGLGFYEFITPLREKNKYKSKYYKTWYRELLYKFFKPKKYKSIYPNL